MGRGLRAGSVAWVAAFALSACATYSDRTESAHAALDRGDVAGGVRELNRFMKLRKSTELPNKWKKDYELVVLERASMLQAMGEHELSARDFQIADKRLEFLDLSSKADQIGKYIYSDSAPKYRSSPTEKLMLNAMNMCNYLVRGDLNGAKIEAKRFTVMRKYLSDYDPEHEHGALGSYLAGFVYERLGAADEALRYYDEALQEREFASLRRPIAILAKRGSYRGERIKDYLGEEPPAPPVQRPAEPPPAAPADPARADIPIQRPTVAEVAMPGVRVAAWGPAAPGAGDGEILVIAKTGRVPYKVPRRIPIGAAIGLAGAYITGDTRLLEYGMFKVVTYPELVATRTVFDHAELAIDGQPFEMELASDLTSEIVREYEDIKPKIIGAAISRMIVRAAAAEGGRAAGNSSDSDAAGLIGFLAAATIEATMVALDRPDTRSWATLPAQIEVARTPVPPGLHQVRLTARGPGGSQVYKAACNVPAGGFCVVDVTTLR